MDIQGTRRLLAAASDAHVSHVAYVSTVGVDQIPYSYYRTKLEAEHLIRASGVPFTIVRATQFHSFIDAILGVLARVPAVMPLPRGFVAQSVSVDEVAARIVRAVGEGPLNATINFGGPELLPFDQMAAHWLAARGVRRALLRVPVPGAIARAFVAEKNTAAMASGASCAGATGSPKGTCQSTPLEVRAAVEVA